MDAIAGQVAAVRRFNRYYTRRIGVLGEGLLGSGFSLAQMRVLWELAHHAGLTASQLEASLGMDAGYLSRLLKDFRARGLVKASASTADARARHLELTTKGARAFAPLERRSGEAVREALAPLAAGDRERLVAAMAAIERLLGGGEGAVPAAVVVREPRPGDFGWVIQRHGALYAEEYGWDATFEALVAEIVAKYIRALKPGRERAWIAERDGGRVGCVFLVERSASVAQLRLLLVEPGARGLRIGSQLVEECLRFARAAGYRKVMLWTNDILHSARHIYERADFRLVKSEKHRSFGKDLVGQNWELKL